MLFDATYLDAASIGTVLVASDVSFSILLSRIVNSLTTLTCNKQTLITNSGLGGALIKLQR